MVWGLVLVVCPRMGAEWLGRLGGVWPTPELPSAWAPATVRPQSLTTNSIFNALDCPIGKGHQPRRIGETPVGRCRPVPSQFRPQVPGIFRAGARAHFPAPLQNLLRGTQRRIARPATAGTARPFHRQRRTDLPPHL